MSLQVLLTKQNGSRRSEQLTTRRGGPSARVSRRPDVYGVKYVRENGWKALSVNAASNGVGDGEVRNKSTVTESGADR